ncbi:hypothetical protein FYJ43_11575 [Cutibacterium sp. WCA-380-WT-3A]|uniref:Uncharacterized protein n=1 Tax=Cutibacterium porci TaxID=2605781 RepID=A0A7K0JA59_9ACTN|nr:hypothetical protein [Cutibacterium porci]
MVTRCGGALVCGRGVYLGVDVVDEVGTTASGTAGIAGEHPTVTAAAATATTTRLTFIIESRRAE